MKIHNTIFLIAALFFLNSANADPKLKEISPESFIDENPSTERKDIVNFITGQVADKSFVSQSQIDEDWGKNDKNSCMARLQIVDQKLYLDLLGIENGDHLQSTFFGRTPTLINYLQNALKNYKIKDVDFLIHLCDGAKVGLNHSPSFLMSKIPQKEFEKDLLLLPDLYMIDSGWNDIIQNISPAREQYKWHDKENKIFWRGATTGGSYNLQNIDKLPRLSLVMLSSIYPKLIDAKFSQYPQITLDEGGEKLRTVLNILQSNNVESVREADHLKYKYLISMDGNTAAWKRVPWIMYSNSVLVKQETIATQWFYPAMKPYVHYVPVNENLTDLFSQIEWMKSHDTELQKISQNAHNFVKNNLMPEHIEAHMVLILNEYHKLHNGEKIKATLTPADQFLTKMENAKKAKKHKSFRWYYKTKQKIAIWWQKLDL